MQNSKHPFYKPVSMAWFPGQMQPSAVASFPASPLLSSVLFLFPVRNVPDLAAYKQDVCVCFKRLHLCARTQTPVCLQGVIYKKIKTLTQGSENFVLQGKGRAEILISFLICL